MIHTKQTDGTDVTTWALPRSAIARLGRGEIRRMTFSPDNEHLVIASRIGCWEYSLTTLEPHALWETERGMVSAISFSQDARWIATGNYEGIVKIWNSQTRQCIAQIGVPENSEVQAEVIHHLTFSPDGQHLAASSVKGNAVYAWQRNTDTPIARFTMERIQAASYIAGCPLVFSPDGSLLAYKSAYEEISVLHIETGNTIEVLSNEYPYHFDCHQLIFSPCSGYLAACNKKSAHVWNIHTGTVEMPAAVYGTIQVIPCYTADGTLRVAGHYPSEVVIWDPAKQEKIDTFVYQGRYRTAACFSSDGKRFAVVNGNGDVHVWAEGLPSTVMSLTGHLRPVDSVVFCQEGRSFMSGTTDYSENLFWDIAQRQVNRKFPLSLANDALPKASALSPTEELLAASPSKGPRKDRSVGTIKIWDLASGIEVVELIEHERQVYTLAFSPTTEYLISVCGERVIVWDTQRWEKCHSLVGHIDTVRAVVAFHPDGSRVVTASPDGLAFLWDVKRGERLLSLPVTKHLMPALYKGSPQDIQRVLAQPEPAHRGIKAIVFSPCGTLIAGGMHIADGMPGEIRVWDAATSETRMAILLPPSCKRPYALAFSPCGRYLASGSWWVMGQAKVSIRLWNVATGKNIATFCGHPTDIQDLAFSPDGTLLASASFDGTILLWDMKPYLHHET